MRIKQFLQDPSITHSLQVGGGRHTITAWLNGDILDGDIYLDATKRIPLPDNCIDYIFTEHFFEHISYDAGLRFLEEAYRILKPGGVIRQATPSLEGLIRIYLDQNSIVSQQIAIDRHLKIHYAKPVDGFTSCQFINDLFRMWGHQFIYDYETLAKIHMDVGFSNVKACSFGESDHALLRNRDRHADVNWMKSAFIIICEATKPNVTNYLYNSGAS